MSNLNEMTIAQLTVELNKLTGKNLKKAKGSKEAIIAKIQELLKPKARKRGPSTKDVLRSLFNKDGAEFTLDELAEKCNTVKLNTIETAIIDLKNPKWSVGPTMNLVKDADGKIIRA
jgi:hypothetical protein